MKIPGSSGMWGLSIPPAMLKPRPELPCRESNTVSFPCREGLLPAFPKPFSPSAAGRGVGALTASVVPQGARLRGQRDARPEGRPALISRGARCSSTEHRPDGAGEWEPPRTSLAAASPPRDSEAGGELGEEGVVLGGENLPLLAVPQEETPMLQPARSSGACASHQHPTPAPLPPGMQPQHGANPGTSSADAKICRIGWRGLSGWSGGLQFCLLFLTDMLGASLEFHPAEVCLRGKAGAVPRLQPHPSSIPG